MYCINCVVKYFINTIQMKCMIKKSSIGKEYPVKGMKKVPWLDALSCMASAETGGSL